MFVTSKLYDKVNARNVELARQVRDLNKENKYIHEENKVLKAKIVDLENNIEFLVNNLSSKKRELVQPSHQN